MKKLYLIRHAKSDWTGNLSDYNRPLNKRGLKDAPIMGKRIFQLYNKPDYIISSGAKRALHTAKLFAESCNYNTKDILIEDDLYHASDHTIINLIKSIPDDYSNVCIFSHNPGISEAVTKLTERYLFLKTCCVVIIEDNIDKWKEINVGNCRLIAHLTPKDNMN